MNTSSVPSISISDSTKKKKNHSNRLNLDARHTKSDTSVVLKAQSLKNKQKNLKTLTPKIKTKSNSKDETDNNSSIGNKILAQNWSEIEINKKVWKLGKLLGTGNGSVVRAGTEKTKDKDKDKTIFAIKIVDLNVPTVEGNRVLRECSALKRISNHPLVIKLQDFEEFTNYIILICEYAPYGDFFELIQKDGKLSEESFRHYFRQLVEALEYCHHNLVAHRDIKPENILLWKDPKHQKLSLKLIDFNYAVKFKPGKKIKSAVGTGLYASPEAWQALPYNGPEVDIWSLGVVMYISLTGVCPWEPDDTNSISSGTYYPLPKTISSEAKELIRRMLDPNPETRISLEEVISHQWTNEGYDSAPHCVCFPDHAPIDRLDKKIISSIITVWPYFSQEYICDRVSRNRPCQVVTTYHLLLKKQKKERNRSKSPKFNVSQSSSPVEHNKKQSKSSKYDLSN